MLSNRIQKIQPSMTLAITAKAKAMKQAGVDVISFGAGEPDFATPRYIRDVAIEKVEEGHIGYTAASGIEELKTAICNKLKEDQGISYQENQIVVSTGAKQALFNTFQAICNPGDEVLIGVPYWVSYPELIKLSDGVPIFVETKKENQYKMTVADLEAARTDKTKAVLVNSPNNPTGVVYDQEELLAIGTWAVKHDIWVISDEIYEKLVYGGVEHISIASLSKEIQEKTIIINGFSKAYAMTGWRIGYSAAPLDLTKGMTSLQSHVSSNPNTISQYAALAALEKESGQVEAMRAVFEKRKELMVKIVSEIPNVQFINPKGAFYVMVDCAFYIKKFNLESASELAQMMLEEASVAVIPGDAFGMNTYIRLSYATSEALIIEGLERIRAYLTR
jgi:aspartate aminotransferase